MTRLLLMVAAGLGAHLLAGAALQGRSDILPRRLVPATERADPTQRMTDWLTQAGLEHVGPVEFLAAEVVLFTVGSGAGFVAFGGLAAPLCTGVAVASWPIASFKRRRVARLDRAQEAWPRMIEEIRLMTGALGRSVPSALFEVGRRGPDDLRGAFEAAEREWLISTDFASTLQVLKDRLGDPTADATCETLLIAHELGGTELDGRLAALAADRIQDTQGRKDARSKQAGVRFARRFVLVVPLAMAGAGMSLGNGRAAYATPSGQLFVLAALALMGACWFWSGRIMRMPDPERVFSR